MMNIFDIGIILLLCMGFIVGWKNGVIKELVSFVGIIIVFIISYQLKGIVGNVLCKLLPFIKNISIFFNFTSCFIFYTIYFINSLIIRLYY